MRRLLPITLLFGLLLSAPTAGAASVSCEPARVDVRGYKLWMQVAGVGEPTVVFESGGGDDSSVWAKIERARALQHRSPATMSCATARNSSSMPPNA
jgi:hypothetical protein